jgi:hypothetical protein
MYFSSVIIEKVGNERIRLGRGKNQTVERE